MNTIQNHQSYFEETFHDLQFEVGETISSRFTDCTFTRCSFGSVVLMDCRFTDCTFIDCDLSLAKISGTAFSETVFKKSRLMGIDWTQGDWASLGFGNTLNFGNCILNHSTFIGLAFKNVQIIKCVAHEVDFREADLTGVNFRGTDLAGSIFGNTNLSDADLSRARNYAIDPGNNNIKQARFSLPEAMSLLYSMDIILEDDDNDVW